MTSFWADRKPPEGWEYQWVVEKIQGVAWPTFVRDAQKAGWEFVREDQDGAPIVRQRGCVLMQKRADAVTESRKKNISAAEAQLNAEYLEKSLQRDLPNGFSVLPNSGEDWFRQGATHVATDDGWVPIQSVQGFMDRAVTGKRETEYVPLWFWLGADAYPAVREISHIDVKPTP